MLQASQSKQEQRQEEAAERRLRKASKEVLQMRGQSQKEPLPVQTFRLGLCRLRLASHTVLKYLTLYLLVITAPTDLRMFNFDHAVEYTCMN